MLPPQIKQTDIDRVDLEIAYLGEETVREQLKPAKFTLLIPSHDRPIPVRGSIVELPGCGHAFLHSEKQELMIAPSGIVKDIRYLQG